MTTESTFDDEARKAYLSSGQTIVRFHQMSDCYREFCPVHNPSEHPYRDWLLQYDEMVGSFFRTDGEKIVIDPDDYTYNRTGYVILRNSAICNFCKKEVESHNRYHFAYCNCGGIAVDGGHVYLRRVGTGDFTETAIVFNRDGSTATTYTL